MRRTVLLCATVLFSLVASAARADFEISLREGGTVLAQSYRIEGDKIVAHKPSGDLEIDRARVVNIRDRGADGPAAAAKPPAVDAPARLAPATRALVLPPSSSTVTPQDASAREGEITRAIILANRDLLFAQNRGEGKQDLDRRRAEIKKLEAERASVRKLLVDR